MPEQTFPLWFLILCAYPYFLDVFIKTTTQFVTIIFKATKCFKIDNKEEQIITFFFSKVGPDDNTRIIKENIVKIQKL